MKNEGWGIKEDQIPSSSHSLHQTMGSQLHILKFLVYALNLQIWLELIFGYCSSVCILVSMDIFWTYLIWRDTYI